MLNFLLCSLFYVNAPFVEMREEPSKTSPLVSQAYYSEEVKIVEERKSWIKIETVVDHYQGWIQKEKLYQRTAPFLTDSIAKVSRNAAHLYHEQDTIYGPILTLPFDSQLQILDLEQDPQSRWIKVGLVDRSEGFIQRGDVSLSRTLLTTEELCTMSLKFLGLPYTWGGRSSFGYDCSGFVQMLYRQMGIFLPRDSKDQVHFEDFISISEEALHPTDLIFFGLTENKIRHVGMYLGNDQFIHATVAENLPFIRISHLKDPEWSGLGKFPYRTMRHLKNLN